MEAPGPPESASGSRDPGTRLAKRGNQWHFGTRCHPGKDAGGGHARGATLAAAGVPDVCEAHGLVRDDDGLCHADAGWRGVARREEVCSDPRPSGAGWRVAMGPSRPGAARRARWPTAGRSGAEASVRTRASALARSSPCSPAPTRPCAPGPGGRRSS